MSMTQCDVSIGFGDSNHGLNSSSFEFPKFRDFKGRETKPRNIFWSGMSEGKMDMNRRICKNCQLELEH
jgi:hypothetical protein